MDSHSPFLRLSAHVARKSVRIRATAAITRNLPALGFVPIRVAGDHRFQALAIGPLDQEPAIEVLRNPYQPSLTDFTMISARIADLLTERTWQVWVPDQAALRACGLEGIRNRRNPDVLPGRERLARICYALLRLEQQPGQQVVAVATDVLAKHLMTGQSASEDAHLWARLAWDHPLTELAPSLVSESRRITAGPTLLELEDDEQAERIRDRARHGKASAAELDELDALLKQGALKSWSILAEAYEVYRNLDIPELPGVEVLVRQSAKKFAIYVAVSPAFGASQESVLREYRNREHQFDVVEDLNARGDKIERERLRQEGRVIRATVLKRARRRRGTACRLVLGTTQEIRRFRNGTKLKTEDNAIEGTVEVIRHTAGQVLFIVRVTRGMTSARALEQGSELDWFDTVVFPFPLSFKRRG